MENSTIDYRRNDSFYSNGARTALAEPNGQKAYAPTPSIWVHRWAVFTVCATFVLLALGAVVTTFQVGMADPIWPTYPWHLLLISWEEPKAGFLIEHTHRLAGYVVGCCVIVLVAGLWKTESRRWLRWLGVATLAAVIVQGLLGGFRVKLNEWLGPNLALVHGSFAPVVFSLIVSLAVFTGKHWSTASSPSEQGLRLRRIAFSLVCLVMLQIVFGAFLRHTFSTLGQRGHLLIAFAVTAGVVLLIREAYGLQPRDRAIRVAALMLACVLGLQLSVGVETWMLKYFVAAAPVSQAVVRTTHVLLGSLVLASSVVVMLHAYRLTATRTQSFHSHRRLEGVA